MKHPISLQSATEFLATYGWMILVLAVLLGLLFELGVFNSSNFVSPQCLFGNGLSCSSAVLASNGAISVGVSQSLIDTINITAVGCNNQVTFAHMRGISPPQTLMSGRNTTFIAQCYQNNTLFSGSLGSVYSGYLLINYTDLNTGASHTLAGALLQKVVK